jgi:ketosteroid isomerase-like protein
MTLADGRQSLPMPDGKSQQFTGYYLSIYKKNGGGWKTVTTTFNLLQALPVSPPPAQKNDK